MYFYGDAANHTMGENVHTRILTRSERSPILAIRYSAPRDVAQSRDVESFGSLCHCEVTESPRGHCGVDYGEQLSIS